MGRPEPISPIGASTASVAALRAQRAAQVQRLADLGMQSLASKSSGSSAAGSLENSIREALSRPDLPLERRGQLVNILIELGNSAREGRLDTTVTKRLQEDFSVLATEPTSPGAGGNRYSGSYAQLYRTAQILQRTDLLPGSVVSYDPNPRALSFLPEGVSPKTDIDIGIQFPDGRFHVESVKYSPSILGSTLGNSIANPARDATQIGRQTDMRLKDPERISLGFFVHEPNGFARSLLDPRKLEALGEAVGDSDSRAITLGQRSYSVAELQALLAAADQRVSEMNADEVKAYATEHFATPEGAMRHLGLKLGAPERPVVHRADLAPTSKLAGQGVGIGALAGGGVSLALSARDGRLTGQELAQAGKDVAAGGIAGGAQVLGERALPAARTMAGRIGGSTAVGTALSVGVSAYENRQGLARGDSQAIGNVTADAAVATASIGGATMAGALAGSVVPGVGTVVGAGVGLVVGGAIALGLNGSGVRDAMAGGVKRAIDTVKSWF